jgi:hypothetical protein
MFKDSVIILDAMRRSFLTKSATAAMFESILDGHLSRHLRFRATFPQASCTNTSVSVADRPALKQNFMATLYTFPPSVTYKEN